MSQKSELVAVSATNRATNLSLSLPGVILAFTITLFVALRIWHITTYSLWGGEAFSMIGARMDWKNMFAYIVADIVHPPLFYIALKLWILIGGESLLWLKLFPALYGIALVVPLLLLCRELNMPRPMTSLAVLLTAANGYVIHYAQELRMYSMFAFLALCSFWLFIRYFKSPGNDLRALFILTIVNLLTIYTHYYGWLVVGLEFLFLLIWRRKIVAFGISMIILLMIFSPWAYLVIQEARSIGGLEQNLDWVPKPQWMDILYFYATLHGPFEGRVLKLVGLLLFNLPLLSWLISILRAGPQTFTSEEVISFSYLSILSILPVIVIFLVSQRLDQAVWIDRYFIFIAAPYFLLVAAAVYRLEPIWVRNIYIGLIVLWTVLGCIIDLRTNRMAWTGAQLGSRIDWESITLQMSEAESGSEYPINVYTPPVVSRGVETGFWTIGTSLDYYLDLHNDARFEMVAVRNNDALINKAQEDHFWVAYFDIAGRTEPKPQRSLEAHGYIIGDEISYDHLGNRIVLFPVWKK